MKRPVLFFVALFCLWTIAPAVFAPAPAAAADLRSLVEAERAFSRLSAEKGIRTAFLANLAPDAIVFRPMPVPGRKAYEESPEIAGRYLASDLCGYLQGRRPRIYDRTI